MSRCSTRVSIQTEAPDVLQSRYIAATHRLLRGLAARGPVVVVCEDIHWADPASIDVARHLMPLAGQLPILFVAAMRAETDAPGWALIGHARELLAEALTDWVGLSASGMPYIRWLPVSRAKFASPSR